MSARVDRAAVLTGWVFVVMGVAVLGRADGLVGGYVGRWNESVRVKRLVKAEWAELTGSGDVLGAGGQVPDLVWFTDYSCPYSRDVHEAVKALAAETPIAVRFLPMPHGASRAAALAAICAGRRGQLMPLHSWLYSNTSWQQAEFRWDSLALTLGISGAEEFLTCIGSPHAASRLAADSAWAVAVSVRSTPVVVRSNGKLYRGSARIGSLLGSDRDGDISLLDLSRR